MQGGGQGFESPHLHHSIRYANLGRHAVGDPHVVTRDDAHFLDELRQQGFAARWRQCIGQDRIERQTEHSRREIEVDWPDVAVVALQRQRGLLTGHRRQAHLDVVDPGLAGLRPQPTLLEGDQVALQAPLQVDSLDDQRGDAALARDMLMPPLPVGLGQGFAQQVGVG